MGLPEDFVGGCTSCMSPIPFPPITSPGLGNFVLSSFLATFAGINYVLQFIPPTPDILPNIKPPGIDLFIAPFMASLKMPPSFPGISLSVGGITVPIPGVGSGPFQRDVSGELKLAVVCIALPFLLIKKMITDLLNLQITLPTLDGIKTLMVSLLAEVGLSGVAVAQFAICLPQAIFNLFTSLI